MWGLRNGQKCDGFGCRSTPYPQASEGERFILLITPPFPSGFPQSRLINLEGACPPTPFPAQGVGRGSRASPPPTGEGNGDLSPRPWDPRTQASTLGVIFAITLETHEGKQAG